MPAPVVDPRTDTDLVAETERLLQRYSPWRPPAQGTDPGRTLVRVFARLAEVVIERLNRAPEKNFLAFLDLLGLEQLPPQPARVPLTFSLAPASPLDGLVPAGTSIAAPPAEGETEPVVFETERELVVTRSQLAAVFARQPERDRYSDASALLAGQAVPAFEGSLPIPHRLLLAHELFALKEEKSVTLAFTPQDPESWPAAVDWSCFDGVNWQSVTAGTPAAKDGAWQVTIAGLPAAAATPLAGIAAPWLRGTLRTSVPQDRIETVEAAGARFRLAATGLAPDAALADTVPIDTSQPFHPFLSAPLHPAFYLASEEIFSKPGARVTIHVEVEGTGAPPPSADLALAWEYFDGSRWQALGRSTPAAAPASGSFEFRDGTLAFTVSGEIGFRCPPDWRAGGAGAGNYWLRVRLDTGHYGLRPTIALTLAYTWPLPRLATIQVSALIHRDALAPELAFCNQVPLDFTKDFFPFGERPRFNDTFYLAQDEAFSKPGGVVTLSFQLTSPQGHETPGLPPPAAPSNLSLEWETWTAGGWQKLGAGTYQFVADGDVTFTLPSEPAPQPTVVGGQRHYWVRVRIAAGDYGREGYYELVDPTKPEKGFVLVPSTLKPPSIKSIKLSYTYTTKAAAPARTLTENDFVTAPRGSGLFNPFTPPTDTQPALYLAVERPGDTAGFANRGVSLYVSPAEIRYDASRTVAASGQPEVVWEYWNGSQWSHLGARDESEGFTRRGMVSFLGPPDFRSSSEFSRTAFWLRARWAGGGYAVPPRLRRALLNTVWASHTLTIRNEVLGSGTGKEDQVFRLGHVPVLPGQKVEVREPEQPSAAERALILAEEGQDAIDIVLGPDGHPAEIWARWREVTDFYASQPRSRHYTLNRLNGEIRFGDGQRGLPPPQGASNVRARWYQSGGGIQGNRPAGTVTQLKTALVSIAGVTNWEAAEGGSAAESQESVKNRGPRMLRHRDRAVTAADFEDLAFQAFSDVALVKAIPASSAESAGQVGLLVVPQSSAPRPVPSLELLARVEDYLRARIAPTVALWVAGPDWLKVTITAEVAPVTPEAATDLQTAILNACAVFLHCLQGGLDGKGWTFGRRPYRSDLIALIEAIPGVDHVRRLTIEEEPEGGSVRPDRFLVFSGNHRIVMVSATED